MVLQSVPGYPVLMADIFDVVADATRRDLLQVLLEQHLASDSGGSGVSVGQLVTRLNVSQPTVSKHLKVLRDVGLVTVREGGQHRYYSIDSSPLEQVEDWLIPFLASDAVGDDQADLALDEAGPAVYSAWAGAQLPAPLRRAAERLPEAGEAGAAVGRVVADVSHRVLSPLKKRLGRAPGAGE
jgi:ArsR family transcriptional regulator, arsenate/arsenite/antimonite-responsive transcriptional repressor